MQSQFLNGLMELIERDTQVQLEDVFRDYEEWDSLAYLSVVAFIDEKYHVIIPFEVFRDFQTVRDIFEYVQNNINEKSNNQRL